MDTEAAKAFIQIVERDTKRLNELKELIRDALLNYTEDKADYYEDKANDIVSKLESVILNESKLVDLLS